MKGSLLYALLWQMLTFFSANRKSAIRVVLGEFSFDYGRNAAFFRKISGQKNTCLVELTSVQRLENEANKQKTF